MPPAHLPSNWHSDETCSALSMRVSSWCCLATSYHCSYFASEASSRAMYTQPLWRKPSSASPVSLASVCQMRFDSIMMGSSAGSRPCWRIQPQLRLDCSPPTRPFSHSVTCTPALARKYAVEIPTTPPPMMSTSVACGSALANAMGVASEIIGMVVADLILMALSKLCRIRLPVRVG